MRDGCWRADEFIGGSSSCSRCPFPSCEMSERGYKVSAELAVSLLPSEDETRQRVREQIKEMRLYQSRFIRVYMADAPLSNVLDSSEACYRELIRDKVCSDSKIYCSDCGLELSRKDDIYRRKLDSGCRCWCDVCCLIEIKAGQCLRLVIDSLILQKRQYERVWKARLN